MSITMVPYAHSKDAKTKEKVRAATMMGLLEKLVRQFDQLDEQMHAGYFNYVLTNISKFVPFSTYSWPIVIFGMPIVFAEMLVMAI